jgi:hypothetical protein
VEAVILATARMMSGAGGFPGRHSPIFSRRSAIGNIDGKAAGVTGIGAGKRCCAAG